MKEPVTAADATGKVGAQHVTRAELRPLLEDGLAAQRRSLDARVWQEAFDAHRTFVDNARVAMPAALKVLDALDVAETALREARPIDGAHAPRCARWTTLEQNDGTTCDCERGARRAVIDRALARIRELAP